MAGRNPALQYWASLLALCANDKHQMTNDKLFEVYLNELLEWNKKFNLTAIKDPEQIKVRHFEDSLSILQAVELKNQKVIDIGTGAGFPGIPLKIIKPGIKLTLIDATRKKTEFLRHIVEILKLSDVEIVWGRAEEVSKKHEYFEKYDVVLARAVAKLDELIPYCAPFLKSGGIFIAQKQDDVADEIKNAKNALKKYSCRILDIKKVAVGDATRSLVIIQKI